MVKKSLVAAVLMMAASCAMAQTNATTETVTESSDKYKVETNRFWSNWFISVGGGAQMYFGDNSDLMDFSDRLAPALDVAVGKWFTPGIGTRLMYSGLKIKNVSVNGAHSIGKQYSNGEGIALQEQEFNFMHFHGDVMFNLSNLFFGENEKRFWNLIPYASAGLIITNDDPSGREISFGGGILNKFRLSKALDLNLDARAVAFGDRFNGEMLGHHQDGLVSITLGLAYKFPLRSWNRSTVKTVKLSDEELVRMRGQLAQMGQENDRLKRALVDASNKTPEKVVESKVISPSYMVAFPIGKSTLSNEARINIGYQAEVMKANRVAMYVIYGYADKATGNKSINERLSRERAQTVYDCLVNEFGVPESKLKKVAAGEVDNMFYDDPRMSRAVITRIE